VSFGSSTEIFFAPHESNSQERSLKQDKLREEHKREEAKIRCVQRVILNFTLGPQGEIHP
jgi:hypothetical protein